MTTLLGRCYIDPQDLARLTNRHVFAWGDHVVRVFDDRRTRWIALYDPNHRGEPLPPLIVPGDTEEEATALATLNGTARWDADGSAVLHPIPPLHLVEVVPAVTHYELQRRRPAIVLTAEREPRHLIGHRLPDDTRPTDIVRQEAKRGIGEQEVIWADDGGIHVQSIVHQRTWGQFATYWCHPDETPDADEWVAFVWESARKFRVPLCASVLGATIEEAREKLDRKQPHGASIEAALAIGQSVLPQRDEDAIWARLRTICIHHQIDESTLREALYPRG